MKTNRAELCVLALAFAVRIAYLVQIHANGSPELFAFLDQMENRYWARTILGGDFFGLHALFPEDVFYRNPVFFKPPGYPYLLALLLLLSRESLIFVQIVQIAVSSAACLLTARLARRFGMSESVAFLAGCAAALSGPLVFLSCQLLPETFFITAALMLLLTLQEFPRTPPSLRALKTGSLLGFSILLRPNIVIFAPFAALWVWQASRETASPRQLAGWGVAAATACALFIAPVAVRNTVVGKDSVLLAYYGGYNFFVGNHPESRHGAAFHDMSGYHQEIKSVTGQLGRKLKASELSALAYSMSLDFITRTPAQFGKILLNKTYRAGNAYEIMSNQDLYHMGRFSSMLRALVWRLGAFGFPMGFVAPLGICGAFLAWRRRKGRIGVLYLVAMTLGMVAFFITFRHRAPLLPVLSIMAAYAVVSLITELQEKRAQAALLLAATAAMAVICNSNWDGFIPAKETQLARSRLAAAYLNKAAALYEMGDVDGVARVLRGAIASEPSDVRPKVALSFILSAARDPGPREGTSALTLARRSAGSRWDHLGLVSLAAAQAETGDFQGAVKTAAQALRLARPDGDSEYVRFLEDMLEDYRAERPYRLPAERRVSPYSIPKWFSHLPPWAIP